MSEQEKNNAIETEGNVTEATKKENFFRRMWNNPKARKIAKWVGRAAEGALIGAIGFAAGKRAALKPIPAEGNLEAPDDDDDAD